MKIRPSIIIKERCVLLKKESFMSGMEWYCWLLNVLLRSLHPVCHWRLRYHDYCEVNVEKTDKIDPEQQFLSTSPCFSSKNE